MRLSAPTWLAVAAAGLAALCRAGLARAGDAESFTPIDAAVAVNVASADATRLPLDVPADADAVVSIDLRRLVDSPAFQKYGKADALQGLQSPPVKALLAALGLDPLRDLDSLLLASSGDVMGANPRALLVARGKFDVGKIQAVAALFAGANPADLKITRTNGLTIYEGATQGKTVYAHLLADGTALLASTDRDYLIQAVRTPSPGPSRAMQNALAKVPDDGAVQIAVVATDAMKKRLTNTLAKRLAPKLEVVTVSIRVTTEVVMRAVVYTTDEAGADDAKGQLALSDKLLLVIPALRPGPFGPLLQTVHDNVVIRKDRTSVQVTVRLTEDFLEKADQLKKSGAFTNP